MSIKMTDTAPILVILGQTVRGYFACLPGHEAAFELKDTQNIDSDSFTGYMDGAGAELVAAVVKQAIGLPVYCGGGSDWIRS